MYEDRITLFESVRGGFEIYVEFERLICKRYPDAEIRPKRTQIGFFDGCGFAWASRPLRGKCGVTITLGLPEKLDSPRVYAATEPYPGRWTHHFILQHPCELDDEFLAWLDCAHDFAQKRAR